MIAALVFAAAAALAADPQPDVERVVLQTSAGGIVLALDSKRAPKTVEHFKRLVRAKVLDGVRFARAEPGYLVQAADALDRARDLTPEQAALLRPVQRELSDLKHVRGALSMAHGANDPDGAVSSFSKNES